MLKKMWIIFKRDLKVNIREFLSLYIIVIPIVFAIGINLLAPSVNDTTVDLILLESEPKEMIDYYSDFANVQTLSSVEVVKERVNKRDNIVAILPEGDGHYILSQGNEPELILEMAKLSKSFYDLDLDINDTNSEIFDFGKTVPPIKKLFVNMMLIMTSVLGGMLIAVNIIEEKNDNTISAMNVAPISRLTFIFGKSLIGIFLSIYGCVALIYLTGFGDANIGQILMIILSCTIISIIVGFIEGIKNDDVMGAAAGVKMLFLPVGAAIAAVELLSDKWQMLFYWVPYYWIYKANDEVLSFGASWVNIMLYTGIVVVISGVIFAILAPQIRKGLE